MNSILDRQIGGLKEDRQIGGLRNFEENKKSCLIGSITCGCIPSGKMVYLNCNYCTRRVYQIEPASSRYQLTYTFIRRIVCACYSILCFFLVQDKRGVFILCRR